MINEQLYDFDDNGTYMHTTGTVFMIPARFMIDMHTMDYMFVPHALDGWLDIPHAGNLEELVESALVSDSTRQIFERARKKAEQAEKLLASPHEHVHIQTIICLRSAAGAFIPVSFDMGYYYNWGTKELMYAHGYLSEYTESVPDNIDDRIEVTIQREQLQVA